WQLTLLNGSLEVVVTLRGGHIDFASSQKTSSEVRLGRYIIEEGLATSQQIEDLLARGPEGAGEVSAQLLDSGLHRPPAAPSENDEATRMVFPNEPKPGSNRPTNPVQKTSLIGDLLVSSGYATEDELRGALSKQTSELIYEALRWKRGRFEFHRKQPSAS